MIGRIRWGTATALLLAVLAVASQIIGVLPFEDNLVVAVAAVVFAVVSIREP